MSQPSEDVSPAFFASKDIIIDKHSGKINVGGFSDLYTGMHEKHGKVALKRLRLGNDTNLWQRQWTRIVLEVNVWQGLRHSRILPFLGLWIYEDSLHLVSPFVENGSLHHFVLQNPDVDRINLLRDVADGLSYLHELQFAHGDLKALNVLISPTGRAMLCDFGLSKATDGTSSLGNPEGTVGWQSPERLENAHRSVEDDVYAYGITIYETLSGQLPFAGLNNFQVITAVTIKGLRPPKEPVASAAGQSYETIWIIAESCWAASPTDRPSMKDVLDWMITPLPAELRTMMSSLSMNAGTEAGNAMAGQGEQVRHQTGPAKKPESLTKRPIDRIIDEERNTSQKQYRNQPPLKAEDAFTALNTTGDIRRERVLPQVERAPITQSERALLDRLDPVGTAAFNTSRVNDSGITVCMQGTRVDVLKKIVAWYHCANPGTSFVFWLNGMAGLGKSTIAKTIAKHAQDSDQLGASFFISRVGEAGLRDPGAIIRTIAYQLAEYNDQYKVAVLQALERRRDVVSLDIENQANLLLWEPLRSLAGLLVPPLVVLDAFDALDETGARCLLSTLLSGSGAHLRILITSRPETYIQKAFRAVAPSANLFLHNIEDTIVEGDIRLYLETKLQEIPDELDLQGPSVWLQPSEREALILNAGKLFVYAATAIRFLSNNPPANPRSQLAKVLAQTEDSASAFGHLDALYVNILEKVARSAEEDLVFGEQFQFLLAAVILIRDSLSVVALEKLIGFLPSTAQSLLLTVTSLIICPVNDSGNIKFYHPSFPEFLSDPKRCRNPVLQIDRAVWERELTIRCLTTIRTSRKTYAHTGHILEELEYSCIYWASHLKETPASDEELLELVDHFASSDFLLWLEIMSANGSIQTALEVLQMAEGWALTSRATDGLSESLKDLWRFLLVFSTPIETGTEQIYTSALPFAPRESFVWKMYGHSAAIKVWVGASMTWVAFMHKHSEHTDTVKSLAFSPNGSLLASGSNDGTVRLWNVKSRSEISTLQGHTASVTTIAFSPDGSWLASGSKDNTARLWDIVSGTDVRTLQGHEGRVRTLAFSPGGSHLASGSNDGTVRLWDVVAGEEVSKLDGHDGYVRALAFSPDGSWLASGSNDQTVQLWDIVFATKVRTLHGHDGWIRKLAFSPNGSLLASASEDGTVRLWNVESGADASILQGHTAPVMTIDFSPDGSWLASGSRDKTVRLWDVVSKTEVRVLQGHGDRVRVLAFSPDGSQLASGSNDRTVRLWNLVTGTEVARLQGHTDEVKTLVFSTDGLHLASGSRDDTVRLWDIPSMKKGLKQQGHTGIVNYITSSLDGSRLATGSVDTTIRLWDTGSGTEVAVLRGHAGAVESLAFSPDGSRLASWSLDETVCIWDTMSGTCLTALQGRAKRIDVLAVSPDGSRLATGLDGRTAQLWAVASKREVTTLRGHSAYIWRLAFARSGIHLASGSADNTVRLWDAQSGAELATFQGHESAINTLAFSPNGSWLVSGSRDNTLRLWDVESRTEVAKWQVHSNPFQAITFSPDASRLSIVGDGTSLNISRTRTSLDWNAKYHASDTRPSRRLCVRFENGWLFIKSDTGEEKRIHIPIILRPDYRRTYAFNPLGNVILVEGMNGPLLLDVRNLFS